MKKIMYYCSFALLVFLSLSLMTSAQENKGNNSNEKIMKSYLIERDIAGASQLLPADLKGISKKSCTVLKELGTDIKWVHSYVAGNKIYCVYKATNVDILREHAKKGGFPITNITEIATIISPATAED